MNKFEDSINSRNEALQGEGRMGYALDRKYFDIQVFSSALPGLGVFALGKY
jgi:hypothetical protein